MIKDVDISIITVTKNSQLYIRQNIESVISQNIKNYEHIIIDAVSTDKTLEIANEYKSDKLVVVSEPDDGVYDAMNKGIYKARGEFIAILNSDDEYIPGALGKILKKYKKEDSVGIICCSGIFFGDKKIIFSNYKKLGYRMTIFHPGVIVRRGIYNKYGVYNSKYRISADYEFFLRLKFNPKFQGQALKIEKNLLSKMRRGGLSSNKILAARENYNIHKKYLNKYIAYIFFYARLIKYKLKNDN